MTRRELLLRSARLAGVASVWAALPARSWAALPAPAGWSAEEEKALDLIEYQLLKTRVTAPFDGIKLTATAKPPQNGSTKRRF